MTKLFLTRAVALAIGRMLTVGVVGAMPAMAQIQEGSSLTVEISGLRNYKGQVVLFLWRDAKETMRFPEASSIQFRDERTGGEACDFPKAVICRRFVQSLQNLTVSYTFANLPAGDYALFAVHDENNNGIMDTGLLGRPLEGRGFSQVLPDELGTVRSKISFQKARFSVSGAKTLTVGLKYPPRLQ